MTLMQFTVHLKLQERIPLYMLWCDLNTVVKMQHGSNLEVTDK